MNSIKTIILNLTVLASAPLAFADSRVTYFPSCGDLMSTFQARVHQSMMAKIYHHEVDFTKDGAAYVGISARELLDLANHGEVLMGSVKYYARVVSTPIVADYRGKQYTFLRPLPMKDAWQLATDEARARSLLAVLRRRFPNAELSAELVMRFLAALKPFDPTAPTFSPNFKHLMLTAEASAMRKAKDRLYPHTKGLALALGLPWENMGEPDAPGRAALAAAFADLPTSVGVVLSLGGSVLEKLTLNARYGPHLKRLDLKDVIGISPISDEEHSFLESLPQ